MEEKTFSQRVYENIARGYECEEAVSRKTKPRELTMQEAKEGIALTEKLLATDPDDLLLMLKQSPNERIAQVFISAYRAVTQQRLKKAMEQRKEAKGDE